MGIIPLKTLTNSQIDRTAGIVTNRFTEFDDDEEQEVAQINAGRNYQVAMQVDE